MGSALPPAPLIGEGGIIRHTGGALTVLSGGGDSGGTDVHGQLEESSRDPTDGVQRWQVTNGVYVVDGCTNTYGERVGKRDWDCVCPLEGIVWSD